MKKTGKHIVLLALAFLSVFAVKAQEMQLYATVDKNPVGVGDVFSYQITLENGRGDITPPSFSGFKTVVGPMQSSSYRIVNGESTSSITVSYRIRPDKEGEFTIGAATAIVNGKAYSTNPITMKIVKGASSQAQQPNRTAPQSGSAAPQNQSGNDANLSVQIQLSKRKVFLGEQISVAYVILTRYRNLDLEDSKFPGLSGFWAEELKADQVRWERDYEMINGLAYRKAVLKRQIIFPQRTGKLQIEPLSIKARANRSFLHPGEEITMVSNSPTIEVLPLPGKSPESFNGAVGEFNFSVKPDRTEVPANEAINLTVTISGSGNLSLVNEPEIKFPTDFETYDPETKDRINVSGSGISGSRSFQYLIIPRYPGDYEIPAVTFSYFDPRSEKFITKTEGPFAIKVTGTPGMSTGAPGERAQSTVKQSIKDIRYIKTDATELISREKQFFKTPPYFLAMGIPFLGFILFLVFRKRRASELDDAEGTRRKKANKMARQRLKLASQALKANDSKLFYAEIFKAIYGYMSDKLGIPGSLLSRQVIIENLQRRNVDADLIHELTNTIEACEMARFAAEHNVSDEEFYNQTVKLISKLDNRIK